MPWRHWLKWLVVADLDEQLLLAQAARRGPWNDCANLPALVGSAHQVTPVGLVLADAEFDSERNHTRPNASSRHAPRAEPCSPSGAKRCCLAWPSTFTGCGVGFFIRGCQQSQAILSASCDYCGKSALLQAEAVRVTTLVFLPGRLIACPSGQKPGAEFYPDSSMQSQDVAYFDCPTKEEEQCA